MFGPFTRGRARGLPPHDLNEHAHGYGRARVRAYELSPHGRVHGYGGVYVHGHVHGRVRVILPCLSSPLRGTSALVHLTRLLFKH
jgi:hypothetical protein